MRFLVFLPFLASLVLGFTDRRDPQRVNHEIDESEFCTYDGEIGHCEAILDCKREIPEEEHFRRRHACSHVPYRETICCGITGSIDYPGRIVGGDDTAPWEYPWMAALLQTPSSRRPFCGGSLISPVHVLTAAHCAKLILPDPTSFRVRIGEHNFDRELETEYRNFRIERVHVHPKYTVTDFALYNDLAILELNSSCMSNPRTVCLPHEPNDFRNHEAVVIGWGALMEEGKPTHTLQEVNVDVYPQEKCKESYHGITDTHLCAGIQENGGKDSCQGDSGGPLHVNMKGKWVQVGIVSYGYGCGRPNQPGVYMNVSSHLLWIADVLDHYTLNDETCGESLHQDPKMLDNCPNGAASLHSLLQPSFPPLTILILFSTSPSFLSLVI